MLDTTFLSRSFSDQGIRLRIGKRRVKMFLLDAIFLTFLGNIIITHYHHFQFISIHGCIHRLGIHLCLSIHLCLNIQVGKCILHFTRVIHP
jgi:hypothetical protein